MTRPTGGYAQILYEVELGATTYSETKRYLDVMAKNLAVLKEALN